MKETRVYGISVYDEDFSEVDPGGWNSMSDEWWMEQAERQGNVWTLGGFQDSFNNENVDVYNMYIRFIETEVN